MAKKPRDKQFALAQNFLRDVRTVRALLDASSIGLSDTVYEIGPGRGIITAELVKMAKKVVAVEKDLALVQYLLVRFHEADNLEIVAGDFLQYRIVDREFKVFANIPFNQTADMMRKILFGSPGLNEAFLVMQREAAEKFSGCPKETQFSVLAKPWFSIQIARKLRRTDFSPAPNVDCVLLHIRKRLTPAVGEEDRILYYKFIQFGFTGWKKNLKLTFKPVFSYRQWRCLSRILCFPLHVTPSELSFEQWVGLFDCFKKRVPDDKQVIVKRQAISFNRNS